MKFRKIENKNILEELAFWLSRRQERTIESFFGYQIEDEKEHVFRSHSLTRNFWNVWYSWMTETPQTLGVYGAGSLRVRKHLGVDAANEVYVVKNDSGNWLYEVFVGDSDTAFSFEDIWLSSYIAPASLEQLAMRPNFRTYDAGTKKTSVEFARTFYNISGGDLLIKEMVLRAGWEHYVASTQFTPTTISRDVFPATITLPDLRQITVKCFLEFTDP